MLRLPPLLFVVFIGNDGIAPTKGIAVPFSYNGRRDEDLVRRPELERLRREYAEGKASGKPEEVDPVRFLQELKAQRAARG